MSVALAPRSPDQKILQISLSHCRACDDPDCIVCAVIRCPHADPFHLRPSGCPSCAEDGHTKQE